MLRSRHAMDMFNERIRSVLHRYQGATAGQAPEDWSGEAELCVTSGCTDIITLTRLCFFCRSAEFAEPPERLALFQSVRDWQAETCTQVACHVEVGSAPCLSCNCVSLSMGTCRGFFTASLCRTQALSCHHKVFSDLIQLVTKANSGSVHNYCIILFTSSHLCLRVFLSAVQQTAWLYTQTATLQFSQTWSAVTKAKRRGRWCPYLSFITLFLLDSLFLVLGSLTSTSLLGLNCLLGRHG